MFYSEFIGVNLTGRKHLQQWTSNSVQEQYHNTAGTVLTFPRRWPPHDMARQPWILAEEYSAGVPHSFQNE